MFERTAVKRRERAGDAPAGVTGLQLVEDADVAVSTIDLPAVTMLTKKCGQIVSALMYSG
jgi:hypothetical protein